MKNLLIYAHDWAPTHGGIQRITQILARGLANWPDWRATLVTMTPADGMNDSALPYAVVRCPSTVSLFSLVRKADVIHLAGPCLLPLAFSLLLRKPVAIEHHGFQAVCPNGQLLYQPDCSPCPGHFMAGHHLECLRCNSRGGAWQSFRAWLLTFWRRNLSTRAGCNILPTNWLGSILRLPRTRKISHGLPLPQVSLVGRSEEVTFLFVGRLVSAKGLNLLLNAAERLKKENLAFRVIIVGDGPEMQALTRQANAAELGQPVFFAGGLSEGDLKEAWAESAVLIAPSIAGEVFGLVVAESMLRGRPAIVPSGGALAEVAGEAGILFPPGDAAGLAACMRRVINDPGCVAVLGERARANAMRAYRAEKMIEEHARTYLDLLAAREI